MRKVGVQGEVAGPRPPPASSGAGPETPHQGGGSRRRRGRASVGLYLVLAFSLCLFTLATVMALSTASSFRHGRSNARLELRSAGQAAAEQANQGAPAVLKTLQGVVAQPG